MSTCIIRLVIHLPWKIIIMHFNFGCLILHTNSIRRPLNMTNKEKVEMMMERSTSLRDILRVYKLLFITTNDAIRAKIGNTKLLYGRNELFKTLQQSWFTVQKLIHSWTILLLRATSSRHFESLAMAKLFSWPGEIPKNTTILHNVKAEFWQKEATVCNGNPIV